MFSETLYIYSQRESGPARPPENCDDSGGECAAIERKCLALTFSPGTD